MESWEYNDVRKRQRMERMCWKRCKIPRGGLHLCVSVCVCVCERLRENYCMCRCVI